MRIFTFHRKGITILFKLNHDEGRYLVKLARQVIESRLGLQKPPRLEDAPQVTREICGVFVTLNRYNAGENSLRGCIGLPYPVKPLLEAVVEAAESAAFADPRFPPVHASEMENLVIEVSVLTPPEILYSDNPLDYPDLIKVGEDGLIIGRGMRQGLLLPQVPVDWKWDSQEFLTQCCFKAGLPPDAWVQKGTEISRFQAIIYAEESPRGEIKKHNLT